MFIPQMRSAMGWHLLFMQPVLILLCLIYPNFLCEAQRGNETDLLALLAFKSKITDDPSGVMSLWNESVHFCDWRGVRCGRRHQRVTELNLHSLKLSGSIPPHIGNLSFLWGIHLSSNSFSQELPPELGRLRRLLYFDVNNNLFSGEIHSNFSGCSKLIAFDVSNNTLSGKLPMEFGSLPKLQGIYIHQNNLTGVIPSSLGNLSYLQDISARSNSIGGNIPDAIGRLPNLTFFALGANFLVGTIPLTIFNLSSITTFDVSQNQIEGSLPSDLGNTLPNLEFLGVALNQFIGTIPTSLSNSSRLKIFAAAVNKFHGKVPNFGKLHNLEWLTISENYLGSEEGDHGLNFISHLTNATNLKVLELYNNSFRGELPETISNLSTTIRLISLTGNQVVGTIPIGILNLVNLQRIELENNRLTGNVPAYIGKLQELRLLRLSGNKLSGYIPTSASNLSRLNELTLGRNNFQGSIPPDLVKCQNLLLLDLSHNNLSGPIPEQIFGLSSLSLYLDLSHNQLNGSLPKTVGNLKNLGKLEISNNFISGEIPSSLSSCTSLEELHMNNNRFRGTIPSSLSSLRGLQYVDLSQNNFSGQIPQFLGDFSLQFLNLSFNNFEGMVPIKGIFENTSDVSISGNVRLCGGVPQLKLPKCDSNVVKKRKRFNQTLKVIIPITLGLAGLTIVLGCLLICWFRRKRKKPLSAFPEYSHFRVSYRDLFKATNGFSSVNLVGLGSFGSVYKGILDNGNVIAVKVLDVQRHGAFKSFIAECKALRNIRHRNLVKLQTACSGVDYKGNDFKALLYEFMVNGSLDDWLHPIQKDEEVIAEPRHLNLLQRLNIAIDIASALHYLQNECQIPIVHCDLKPSNVLLDSEMTGHVGDFGLARLVLQQTNNFSENQASSSGIKGSIGYAPPEYGMGSKASMNGDVYSYGILLLEMFTGKRPTDDMFHESLNLHDYAKKAFPARVVDITDSILFQQGESDTSGNTNNTSNEHHIPNQNTQECLVCVFGIGIACSEDSPKERMDISNVAARLRAIRDTLIRAGGRPRRTNAITTQPSLGASELITLPEVGSPVKHLEFYTV